MTFSRHLPVVISVYQCKYAAPSLEVTHPLPHGVLTRALPDGRATAPVVNFRPILGISRESRHRVSAARLQEIDARHREIASRHGENACQLQEIYTRDRAKTARRTAKTSRQSENANPHTARAAKLGAKASHRTAHVIHTLANHTHKRANASHYPEPRAHHCTIAVHKGASSSHRRDVAPAWRKLSTPQLRRRKMNNDQTNRVTMFKTTIGV